ncbi:MAG: hypothetical protein IKJ14_02320 [Clostridia bacterium]|nr:hypothetical protein [Clostridia bacterium]
MKKKTLFTAILTLAMCLSLTIGATFALFSSESEVNVAVSSANVEVKAVVGDLNVDMYAGTASKNGGEVSIERMLPGDSVSFDITVENYSNVPVQYRTVISSEDSGLFNALKITLNDKVYGGGYVYEDWAELVPSDNDAETKDNVKLINVKVEFPETGADQSIYNNTNCKFNVKVEAVQGNHEVVNPITKIDDLHYEVNSEEGMMLMNGIANTVSHGEGVELNFKLTNDMNMTGYNWIPVAGLFVNVDGNGKTISNLNCGIDDWGRSGFIGYFGGGKITNLTLENVTSKGSQAGLVAGSLEGAYFENVVIKGNNTVTYDYLANTQEAWGGAGVIAAVGSYVNANSSVVIENGANVVVNYNGLITSAPYGSEYCLISDVSAIVTNNGTITVNGEYKKLVAEGFYMDKDGNYLVESAIGLQNFASLVNDGTDFNGATVLLTTNLDLAGINWMPIGRDKDVNSLKGVTFDGQNHVISNLTADRDENRIGLFGCIQNSNIKNLTLNNVDVKGVSVVGTLIGQMWTSVVDNCHVTGTIKVSANHMAGGLIGQSYSKVLNSSVIADENSDSFVVASFLGGNYEGDNVGGLVGHTDFSNNYATFSNVTVKNLLIKGTRKVGGLIGYSSTFVITNPTIDNCVITTDFSDYVYENASKIFVGGILGENVQPTIEGTATVTNTKISGLTGKTGYIAGGSRTAGYEVTNNATLVTTGSSINETVIDSATAVSTLANATEGTFLVDCEFVMPTLKAGANIVIEGASENAVVDLNACNANGANVTFKNINVEGIDAKNNTVGAGGWYTEQLVGANKVVFEKCSFTNTITVYSTTEFYDCTFTSNDNAVEEYSIYFYSGNNHVVDDCTFNSNGKMIKVYSENSALTMKVTVKNSKFNALKANKAAVEVDTSTGFKTYVYMDNNVLDGVNVTNYYTTEAARLVNANIRIDGTWEVGSEPA